MRHTYKEAQWKFKKSKDVVVLTPIDEIVHILTLEIEQEISKELLNKLMK